MIGNGTPGTNPKTQMIAAISAVYTKSFVLNMFILLT